MEPTVSITSVVVRLALAIALGLALITLIAGIEDSQTECGGA